MSTTLKPKWIFLCGLILTVSLVIAAGVLSAKRRLRHPAQSDSSISIRPVGSKVKDLEIINERIVRQNTDIPGIAFEVLNKSNRNVMAIHISCGDASISKDGLEDEEAPTVVIEPHRTLSAEMTDLGRGPIVITSATFQDGSEEGDPASVDLMQRLRARGRAQRKAERDKQSR